MQATLFTSWCRDAKISFCRGRKWCFTAAFAYRLLEIPADSSQAACLHEAGRFQCSPVSHLAPEPSILLLFSQGGHDACLAFFFFFWCGWQMTDFMKFVCFWKFNKVQLVPPGHYWQQETRNRSGGSACAPAWAAAVFLGTFSNIWAKVTFGSNQWPLSQTFRGPFTDWSLIHMSILQGQPKKLKVLCNKAPTCELFRHQSIC